MVLLEGLRLMAVGMTVVFCFLVLLVAAMRVSAACLGRSSGDSLVPMPSPQKAAPPADTMPEVAAAIAAAFARRKR